MNGLPVRSRMIDDGRFEEDAQLAQEPQMARRRSARFIIEPLRRPGEVQPFGGHRMAAALLLARDGDDFVDQGSEPCRRRALNRAQ